MLRAMLKGNTWVLQVLLLLMGTRMAFLYHCVGVIHDLFQWGPWPLSQSRSSIPPENDALPGGLDIDLGA